MVPRGTHDWSKYIKPERLAELITHAQHPAYASFRDANNEARPQTPSLPKPMPSAPSETAASSAGDSLATSAPSSLGFRVSDISGMLYDPLRGIWFLDPADAEVNYILTAVRAGNSTATPPAASARQ
jgi:2-polyprenyl-3-methyl-5-hydroxy-6-metoxy-1,4-benzoquinol methylase